MKKIPAFLLILALLLTLPSCLRPSGGEQESSSPSLLESSAVSETVPSVSPQSGTSETSEGVTSKPSSSDSEPERQVVTITFPEGYTFIRMAQKLEENGICTVKELMDVVNTYDFSKYPLVAGIPQNENRCFRLEGYLFPDTYQFYTNSAPEDILGKMIRNTENRIPDSYRQRASELGYSMDQILTIASLIQGEAGNPQEIGKISSIIYNRLDIGMKLQVDASINYVEKWLKPYIGGDINRYNSYYNTYKCSALPSGPIGNPGLNWIKAALYPEDTGYLYFVNDADGNYYYADNLDEHKANCEKAGISVE